MSKLKKKILEKKILEKKRNLTNEEIEDILFCIQLQPDIPEEVALCIMNNNKKKLTNQLKKQDIYPSQICLLKEEIEKQYISTLVQPGESVGVICAQSVGERQTQMTLNSDYTSGSINLTLTQGVPRVQELLNATLNPKNVISKIYFKKQHLTISELRKTIDNNLVELTFKSISNEIIININKEEESWYSAYKLLYNLPTNFNYTDCLTIKLNMDILYEYNLTYEKISSYINDNWNDMICIFSPPQFGQLDIFVDVTNISLPNDRLLFINEENVKEIYLEEVVQPILEKTIITGIPGIKSLFFVREKKDKNKTEDNWYIETAGSNLQTVLSVPFIDETRTISNNEWEIYHTFGIEAVRKFLIEEFISIMEGINLAHIQLLVDRMTSSGTISSITRYTMRKEDSGPFGKASFEESMDNFLKAANNGDIESTNGVSASIICGKKSKIGTGMINVSVDIDNLPNKSVLFDKVHERY
jgi:DNA-directed RNA polymerase beta' subunit